MNTQTIVIILVVVAVIVGYILYTQRSNSDTESYAPIMTPNLNLYNSPLNSKHVSYDNDNSMAPSDNYVESENDSQTPYNQSQSNNTSVLDKFDSKKLLPMNTTDNVFESPYKQCDVTNQHLINSHRPLGINRILTNRKNVSLDMRGDVMAIPKTMVPFNWPTNEPDIGNRLCV